MGKIPHADEGRVCPLHKAEMSAVCHKCPLWVQLRGTNSNTGQEIDDWNCSLAWLPMLLVENAQQSRQTGAAVETFRNVMVALNRPGRPLLNGDAP
jgi:succinyl-CoA synthetase beta subunit